MALTALSEKSLRKSQKEEGILLHNGNKFAVGLTWLTADDEVDVRLAKDRARKMEADFYAMRTTVSTQQGFGSLAQGHRAGMPSAASLASDMLVGEWHGVFTADNGWWYVAVHADSIAPDGDIFFFSEEDAYQHFQSRAADYKWPRSYAPENWNLPDANNSITLEKLLDDKDRAAVLRPATLNAIFGGPKQKSMAFLVLGIFLAFLIVAFIAPTLFSAQKPDLNQLVRSRILAPTKIFAPPPLPQAAQLEAVDLTGLRAATPSLLVNICANTFARVILPLPGWDMIGLTCNASNQASPNVVAMWQKKSGSLDTVRGYIANFPDNVTVNFNGNNQIAARTSAGNLSAIIKPMELGTREPIIQALYDRFGGMGRLDIKDVTPPAPLPKKGVEGFVEQEPPPPPPPYLQFKLITQTPPNIIASYFDVSGLKVQNIQWNRRNGSWTYDAEIQYDSKTLREYYAYQQRMQQRQ